MDVVEELNSEQRAAATAADGPVLIVAGPGTGKTKTLAARIAYLIASGRAQPEQILALTFTKKAAEEMRSRVSTLVDVAPVISTFHALCYEILGGQDLEFASEAARLNIIKKLPKPASLKGFTTRELALQISRAKNLAGADPELDKLTAAYDAVLNEQHLLDFDDLLTRTRDLLRADAQTQKDLQNRFTHILVDEFQDTNNLQYELLQLMRGTANLFVIGDPLQSIYGFRGASGSIFDRFRHDFPDALEVALTINYRSVPGVVALSNAVFATAPQLVTHASNMQQAGHVQTVQIFNEYAEADWVLRQIHKAIGGGDFLQAVSDDDSAEHRPLKDFAIVYRSRSAAQVMQRAIAESGLPYQVVGEGSPYEKPEVQAIIALLRAHISDDAPAHEGFTASEWRRLLDVLAQHDGSNPHALAVKIIDMLGLELTADLQQFLNGLVRFSSVRSALQHLDAMSEQAFYDPAAEAVTLLTIHAAKGLEFPYVFLIAAEDGVLPHARSDIDEERRLFYVAITRARHNLDILHTARRGGQQATMSRFAAALPEQVLPRHTDPNLADDRRRAQKRAIKRSQQRLF
ncbi:MAG TPA: ATP-dependent helicase [Candidatus Saccharimonadales bacterium]|nr:ATP-dependent helicase [Candidatus Saccharimonadales bacterium]